MQGPNIGNETILIALIPCNFITEYVNRDMDIQYLYIYLEINAVHTEEVGVILARWFLATPTHLSGLSILASWAHAASLLLPF